MPLPKGGFAIAGMHSVEPPHARDRAMYKQATWRVAVLSAGARNELAIRLVLIGCCLGLL